jgi:hypothetical protein
MAMTLASQPGVATSPNGQLQTSYNYISEYDYATVYKPELVMKLHPRYGNGLITGFCKITGSEKDYESDLVKHTEQGRLHQLVSGVTITGSTFTTPVAHNLRVNDTIIISDGTTQKQADVTAVNSTTEFEAANRASGAFGFDTVTKTVSLFAFSSDFGKGTSGFNAGRTWKPDMYENYTHTMKEYFDVAESDVAHVSWVNTPQGERWYSYDMERTRVLMQNKIEMTHLMNERAEAGSDAANAGKGGMNGIIPTINSRGNVGNGYIETLDQLDQITFRLKKQGAGTVYTVWCDQIQLNYFNKMLSAVNAPFSGGANYGVFNNSKDLALYLDFHSFVRNGITFHLTPWKLFDDPTLFGADDFLGTSLACLFVPAGEKMVQENGGAEAKPYISIRSRVGGGANRKLKTKIFGLFGTETREDKVQVEYIAEQTNQVVGANEWLVVNK